MPKASSKATSKSKGRGVEKKKKGPYYEFTFDRSPLMVIDPNAPKRGLSAYMFFANDQRENVREENPGISFGKILHS